MTPPRMTYRAAADGATILGRFDLTTFELNFSADYLRRVDQAALTSDGAYAGIPDPVLAHELSHLIMLGATNAGTQAFFAALTRDALFLDVIRQVSRLTGGDLPIGILDAAGEYPVGIQRGLAAAEGFRMLQLHLDGGVTVPPDLVDFSNSDLVAVEDLFMAGATSWCVDLAPLSAARRQPITLGSAVLNEGIAACVELMAVSRAGGDFAEAYASMPRYPYHVAYDVYHAVLRAEDPSEPPLPGEFVALADAGLMYDSWAEDIVRERTPQSRINPFGRFVQLLVAFRTLGRRLRSTEPDTVAEFQDALLAAAGAPCPDVRLMTERLALVQADTLTDYPDLPWLDRYAAKWRLALDMAVSLRRRRGGGACQLALADSSREVLLHIAKFAGNGSGVGAMTLSDGDTGHDEAAGLLWSLQVTAHLPEIAEELVMGPQECRRRHRPCTLEPRAMCGGLTAEIGPPGRRCPKEAAAASLQEWVRAAVRG